MTYLYNTGKHFACFTDQNRIKLDKLKVVYSRAYGRDFTKLTAFLKESIQMAQTEKREHGIQINVTAPKNFNVLMSREMDAANIILNVGAKVNKTFSSLFNPIKRVLVPRKSA